MKLIDIGRRFVKWTRYKLLCVLLIETFVLCTAKPYNHYIFAQRANGLVQKNRLFNITTAAVQTFLAPDKRIKLN